MKHLLNNISKEEKQSILEQHKGGMKIFNENFNNMVNKKLGHVELYEQLETSDDSSIFSTKKISELSDNDKEKLRSTDSGTWDSLVKNLTFKGQDFNEEYVKKLLSSLNLLIVEKALAMTSLSMDDAIERVISMLPQYFKDETHITNYSYLSRNLADVQNMLNDQKGLEQAKKVALQNYNHNKTRQFGA